MLITYTLKGYYDTAGRNEEECGENLQYVLIALRKRYDLHLEIVHEEILEPEKD